MVANKTVIKEEQNQYLVVQGESRTVPVTLLLSNKDFKTFDITGATEIVARFPGQNSNFIDVTLTGAGITIVNAVGGSIDITLTTTTTEALNVGERQNFEVVITLPTQVRIAQIIGRLNVRARISC